MSDRKINVVTELLAEQGVAAVITLTVDNASLSDIEFENPEDNGVAIDYNAETGEVTFVCNTLGAHEIGVSFIDSEELDEIITINVSEAAESTEKVAPTVETPVEETKAPAIEEVVEEKPVVEKVKVPVEAKAPADAPVVVEQVHAPVVSSNTSITELMNFLNEYSSKMDLRAMVDPAAGIAMQTRLYKMIMKVLSKEGAAFKENMDALIGFVKENRTGVFNERGIGRFVPQLRLNKEEAMLFTRLTTMLIVTADVDHLGLVSQRIDFKFIGARLKNDSVMQRLQYYYNPTSE